jgi:hypothetical protein
LWFCAKGKAALFPRNPKPVNAGLFGQPRVAQGIEEPPPGGLVREWHEIKL